MICKTFGILPNDPQLRALAPLQIVWIYNNLLADFEAQKEAFDGMGNNGKTVTRIDAEQGVAAGDVNKLLQDLK